MEKLKEIMQKHLSQFELEADLGIAISDVVKEALSENIPKYYWPDDVRLKMIEKSEFYPEQEKVYQYGYYDGFQEYHSNHTSLLQARIAELEKQNEHLKRI